MNPLREIPLLLMPHLPDTLFGQGVALAAGVMATLVVILGAPGVALYIATRMGYVK